MEESTQDNTEVIRGSLWKGKNHFYDFLRTKKETSSPRE